MNHTKVIDLLNPGPKRSNLTVRWNKKSRAFVVDNLFSIECEEFDDLVAVLEEGMLIVILTILVSFYNPVYLNNILTSTFHQSSFFCKVSVTVPLEHII